MLANKGRDTKPEMAVRRALHARGHRYRVDIRPIPALNRRADLVFTRLRVAVFVDGCYWHGCPAHYTAPSTNITYWSEKVTKNRSRDLETSRLLQEAGWTVVRAWEHEPVSEVVGRVEVALARRRGMDEA